MVEEHLTLRQLEEAHGSADEEQGLEPLHSDVATGAAPRHGDPREALLRLRQSVRERLQRRPYLVLGGMCGVGILLGARMGAREMGLVHLLRIAVRSGVASVVRDMLGR